MVSADADRGLLRRKRCAAERSGRYPAFAYWASARTRTRTRTRNLSVILSHTALLPVTRYDSL